MNYPGSRDFLEAFGITPVEEDPSMAYYRYVKTAQEGALEIDFSFSGVAESFQVVLRCSGNELATVSSENVKSLRLRHDRSGSGVHVVFDIHDVISEAIVWLEPQLKCCWWTLRNA